MVVPVFLAISGCPRFKLGVRIMVRVEFRGKFRVRFRNRVRVG